MVEKIFKLFISSTFTDLEDIRNEVINGVLKAGHLPVMMEGFPATDTQKEMITKKISACDAYIVIIGSKYGSIDSESGLSYTEWEYDYAFEKGLPIYTMILTEDFIQSRVESKKIKIKDIETTKPEYIAFVEKAKTRLVDFVSNLEQVKSMSEASILHIVRDYGDKMIGWVHGTILEDLINSQKEVDRLRQTRSQLQVKLADSRSKNVRMTSFPNNQIFDNLLAERFQPHSTDSIIEDGIVYIKDFVKEKVNQLKEKIDHHRGNIAMGYDDNKKAEVLFRLDPDSITYLADYNHSIIDVKVKINKPWFYKSVDRLIVKNGVLKSENFAEELSFDYLNKTLDLYYEKKRTTD